MHRGHHLNRRARERTSGLARAAAVPSIGVAQMPVTVTSPITSRARDPKLPTSPGARSMPGARQDSVPSQTPASASPVASRGAESEPGLPVEGRSDSISGPVQWHLARHAALRLGRED
jgi:hypothetical protein